MLMARHQVVLRSVLLGQHEYRFLSFLKRTTLSRYTIIDSSSVIYLIRARDV